MKDRIEKSIDLALIETDLGNELLKFAKEIRNNLTHPKGPHTHYFLGGKFDPRTASWNKEFSLDEVAIVENDTIIGLRLNPNQNMKKVAEYSLELFIRTIDNFVKYRSEIK